jgi:pyrroline-5-carboxylate reductase
MMRLGFVGVGAMSAAMVEALATGPVADTVSIVLSPRNVQRSAQLAARFEQVTVVESNQAVLDASDMVFLGMLPRQVDEVCRELAFRPDHLVASVVAGLPPSQVAPHVAPATQICQMIPLPVIALHTGPIVICPAMPEVMAVFQGCGEFVTLEDESTIRILSCTSASMSTFFEYQQRVYEWTVKAGLSAEKAHTYVTSLYRGLATEAQHALPEDLAKFPAEHETPGGLNAHVRRSMIESGAFDTLEQALDYIYYHKNYARSED